MRLVDRIKKKLRPYYRDEQTGLRKYLMCRIIVEINSLRYCIMHWKLRSRNMLSLTKLRGKRAKNVFVFANGPSMNALDFEKIKGLKDSGEFDLITVNSFASKAIKKYNIIPTLGVFADTSHYRTEDDPEHSEQSEEDVQVMNEFDVTALVPYHYFKVSRFKHSIPYCGVFNVYRNNVHDMHKPLGFYRITAFYAIATALNLEYENVYICGYDNCYFKTFGVDMDNQKYFDNEHFYDSGSNKLHLPKEKYGTTVNIFYDTYRHFKFLEKIRRNSKKQSNIYNIAKTTFTDAFERNFKLNVYHDEQELSE